MQPCRCSKYTDVILVELLSDCTGLLIFCDKGMECLVKWSVITSTGTTVGVVCRLSSPLTLMEFKSMCTKSRGAVAIMGCNGSFDELN